MPRKMEDRLQKLVSQFVPIAGERADQAAIRVGIAVELPRCKIDIPIQAGCRTVIERVRQWNFRLDPLETKLLQRQSFEKRRTGRERMNCRTNIMQKSRQR